MKTPAFSLYATLPLLALVGCQTLPYQPYAREVKRKPGVGGEISLKVEHRDEDRAKAQQLMDSNCGALPPKIEEEGEVVVGSVTNSQASETRNNGTTGTQVGSLWGMPITSGSRQASNDVNTSATTTAVKEWVLKYNCAKVESAVGETADSSAAPIKKHLKK